MGIKFISYEQFKKDYGYSAKDDPCKYCVADESEDDACMNYKCEGGLMVNENVSERTITGGEYPLADEGFQTDKGWTLQQEVVDGLEGALDVMRGEDHDAKKSDITKAKPGQMMDDFNLALLAVSEVTRYGVEKYERPGSWKHAHKDLMKYKDAMMRHYLKSPSNPYDDESGYLHLIQVAWNVLALLQMMLEFNNVKPRDLEAITKPLGGLTQKEPDWFEEEK